MKHLYIIYAILSSFFTYKTICAKEDLLQYAFYIPQDAFQYNTFEQPKQQEKTLTTKKEIIPTISYENTNIKKEETPKETSKKETNTPQKEKIATKKTPLKNQSETKTTVKNKEKSKKTLVYKEKPKQENKTPKEEKIKQNIAATNINNTKEKSISEIFAEIPFPSDNMIKYQKAYLDYVMSLRVLYRTKKFPPNPKQEETLSKAKSIRRFEI